MDNIAAPLVLHYTCFRKIRFHFRGFLNLRKRTFVEDCDWWNFFGLQLHPQRSSMATPSCLHGAASTMDALVLAILAFFVYGWLCSPSVCGFSLLLASL